jgi:hypothetical protein
MHAFNFRPRSWGRPDFLKLQGVTTFPDGSMYQGEFNCKFEGHGTFTFPDGSMYCGEFVKGEFDGRGSFTFKDGSVYRGDFVNGKFEGHGKFTSSDGKVIYDGLWEKNEQVKKKRTKTKASRW